jgi:ABC-type multidrug transport system permease subunit
MYYITPFKYWIGGTMAMMLDGRPVVCEADELVHFELPIDSTCGTFAQPFLQSASGYIANPNESRAGELCGYCQYSSGEDVSYPTCHVVEHYGLTLDLLAVFGQVRPIGIIDLARFWHFPRFRSC